MTALRWLPENPAWRTELRAMRAAGSASWADIERLAQAPLDFARTNALDQLRKAAIPAPPAKLGTKPVRLAILGSSTLAHLAPAIRIAGARRSIWIDIHEGEYGQYLQELAEPPEALRDFEPTALLLALDARHLTRGIDASMSQADADAARHEVCGTIAQSWQRAQDAFGCLVIHQTALDAFPSVLGQNEHRLPGSPRNFLARLNHELRILADRHGVDLLALDDAAHTDGLAAWHDPALWDRSKQEVTPLAAPAYGELVGRLLAARQGRSYKCLVLDLDNTLWGGVIGDDGIDGIAIGQGNALGEGFASLQAYAKELARRGVILAVCSKNDEANALEPFDRHPEMVLRRTDIACFRANWDDKASNIRAIAADLNIGLDSLVFLDDNPFERNLVRTELPMVAVPEWHDEPALVPAILADAGYFESLGITDEDRERTTQYQANRARETFKADVTDMEGYLRGLDMTMVWSRFDRIGLQRVVQLINKTNQFNLTTRRHTEADVQAVMDDPHAFGLQLRLTDRFGDNGIIGIVIGRLQQDRTVAIDTWLMSCRVLGRGVEPATLNLVAAEAKRLGASAILGEYIPTKKNGMVREHYRTLGFAIVSQQEDGASVARLELAAFTPADTFIAIKHAA